MARNRCCECLSVLFAVISLGFSVVLDIQGIQTQPPTTVEAVEECYGTFNSLSFSGSLENHYESMRDRYLGCTHVIGNLEITHLSSTSIDYDLSFLKDIRYVSGYVLIALVTQAREIPLHSLEIIRGNNSFIIENNSYTLAVVITYPVSNRTAGLKELQLPALKEISSGRVLFFSNPSLGFVNTIHWEAITRDRPNAMNFSTDAYDESVSSNYMGFDCPSGRMWGKGYCQADVPDIQCHSNCDGRCFGTGSDECCHATCAVGCDGPTNQDCILCKDYEYNSGCVGFCPARSYPDEQNCVPS